MDADASNVLAGYHRIGLHHSRQELYRSPLLSCITNLISLPHKRRMRTRLPSRPIQHNLRRRHRNSPPLRRVQRLRRTRHVALLLLHRLLTIWLLPLHFWIYITLQQRLLLLLLLLLIVDRDEAAIGACCQFGDHSAGDLGCFFGYGAGVACGVDRVAAGVGVAAGGDEEGEVEEPGEDCALVCEIHREKGGGRRLVDIHHDPRERAPHRNHNTNMSHQSIKRIPRRTAHIRTIRHVRPIRSSVIARSVREYPTISNTTLIVGTIIIILIKQIAHSAHSRNPRRDTQPKPENEIASHICAGVYPSIAQEESDYVDNVPDDGKAKCDEYPGEEHGVAIVEIVGSDVVLFFHDVGGGVAVVWDGCYGPGYGADGYSGEDDGEDAKEEFPEEGTIMLLYSGS